MALSGTIGAGSRQRRIGGRREPGRRTGHACVICDVDKHRCPSKPARPRPV